MSLGNWHWLAKTRGQLGRRSKFQKALIKRRKRQGDSHRHKRESGYEVPIDETREADPASVKENKFEKPKRPSATRAEITIAWFTGALLFVAVVAAVATALQWQAAKDALSFAKQSASDSGNETQAALNISDEIADATRNASISAAQSARFSGKQVSVAESVATNDSRPFVEALGAGFFENPVTSKTQHIGALYVTNVGNSPALVKSGYYFKTGALRISKLDQQYFGSNKSCNLLFDGRYTIFPKTPAPFTYEIRLPAENVTDAVLQNRAAIAIEGCLIYPVGKVLKRTEYCYIVAGKGVYPKLGSRLCADGNYAN